jgi:hypothetical protein
MIAEPLSELIRHHPKVNPHVAQQLKQAFQWSITDKDFRTAKERICLATELFPIVKNVDKQKRGRILLAVLAGEVERAKGIMIANSTSLTSKDQASSNTPSHWVLRSARKWIVAGNADADLVDGLIRDATRTAQQTTDSQFLTKLARDVEQHPALTRFADDARQRAYIYLEPAIDRLLKKLVPSVQQIQETDCKTEIERECASLEKEDQRKLRVDLIRSLNGLSKQTPYT